jgi:anti-anti-sigma factor
VSSLRQQQEAPTQPGTRSWFDVERLQPDTAVVHVAGEVDDAVVPELRRLVERQLIRSPGVMLIDFAAVTFIDSAGVELLVWAQRRADAASASLFIVPDSEGLVNRVLRLAGVEEGITGRVAAPAEHQLAAAR